MLIHQQIDWEPVCATFDLKRGAATKRWSRLKKTMEEGRDPGGDTYSFLWECVKHLKRDKVSTSA